MEQVYFYIKEKVHTWGFSLINSAIYIQGYVPEHAYVNHCDLVGACTEKWHHSPQPITNITCRGIQRCGQRYSRQEVTVSWFYSFLLRVSSSYKLDSHREKYHVWCKYFSSLTVLDNSLQMHAFQVCLLLSIQSKAVNKWNRAWRSLQAFQVLWRLWQKLTWVPTKNTKTSSQKLIPQAYFV